MKKLLAIIIIMLFAMNLQAQSGTPQKSSASVHNQYTREAFGDSSAAYMSLFKVHKGVIDSLRDVQAELLDSLNELKTELIGLGVSLDSIEVNIEEANILLQYLDNNSVVSEAKLDSIDAVISRVHLELIKKIDKANGDSIEANIEENNTLTQANRVSLDNIETYTAPRAAIGYGQNAITTAEALAGSTACKSVTITNYTSGEYIYVGSNASVTTSNGYPLGYLDDMTLTVDNLNKVYLVSDGTSVDIRFIYEN